MQLVVKAAESINALVGTVKYQQINIAFLEWKSTSPGDGKERGKRNATQLMCGTYTEQKGQAKKSKGRMPWRQEPKKDAVSSEMPRGDANGQRSADVRMGKPGRENLCHCILNT